MNRKSMLLCSLLACTSLMFSCNSSSKESAKEETNKPLVGNDRDDHGCIASAGYQWSELLKDCIRPWEKGVKLSIASDSTSTSAAYLVFNSDSSQVEVFLPKKEDRPILNREEGIHATCWSDTSHTDITVKSENGTYAVFQNDEPLFWQ